MCVEKVFYGMKDRKACNLSRINLGINLLACAQHSKLLTLHPYFQPESSYSIYDHGPIETVEG